MMHMLCNRGYTRFFKRRHLETSNFLKDDCLKINCTIVVLVSSIDYSQLNTIQVPESDIGEHFGMLLEDEESFDVTFSVGGERFHAHKLVLAARSTMFETQFFNAMKKDDQEIVVIDMEPKVFKVSHSLKVPLFLYTFVAVFCSTQDICYLIQLKSGLSFGWLSNFNRVLC